MLFLILCHNAAYKGSSLEVLNYAVQILLDLHGVMSR